MVSESHQEAKRRRAREDKARCQEAAQKLRHRIRAGEYDRLPHTSAADLLHVAAILDAANIELSDLPRGSRSAVLGLVGSVLDDGKKPRQVDPITSPLGEGH